MTHKGKWAVITGATNPIGRALSNKCGKLFINIVLIDIDESSLLSIKSQLLSKYPVCILHYKCDVSNEQAVKHMIKAFQKDHNLLSESKTNHVSSPVVHFLFNNAEITLFTNILNGDLKTMHKTMDTNLFGMIYVTQSLLPFLQNIALEHNVNDTNDTNDRFIVNTSSISGVSSADSFHAVTKQGVSALSETFLCELKQYNKQCKKQQNGRGVIHVSCLVPSYVHSSYFDSADTVHYVHNVLDHLQKPKTYNSSSAHPELWEESGIDASIVADIVFEKGIKMKHFCIDTHKVWNKTTMIDKYYSIYTQTFNRYHETKKMYRKYVENLKQIVNNQVK